MKLYRIIIVYFLISLMSGLVNARPVQAAPLICKPVAVTDIVAWLPGQDVGVPVSNAAALFRALYQLQGPAFWRRVGDYGKFDVPHDATNEATFWLMPSRNYIWFASSPEHPDVVFAYFFWDAPEFADARGQHFGVHPCRDLIISREVANAIYRKATY